MGKKLEIRADGLDAHVVIDGQDVSDVVREATLRLQAGQVPELEIEFLATDTVIEIGGRVSYLAHGFGATKWGDDPVAVLRELADAIETERALEVAHG